MSAAPLPTAAPRVDLSVVVAALGAEPACQASVRALEAACVDLRAEILVVAGGPSVPDQWASGIQQAKGTVVALTTSHMIVEPAWARALMEALVLPAAGAGGPMDLMPGTRVVDWAIFYLRYSSFLPSRWHDGPTNGEIAGDNAAYWLDDLLRHQRESRRGFWEVEFHQRMRADGRTLRAVSRACARLGPSYRFGAFMRQRLAHGRYFGHQRAENGERSRLAIVAAAPLVPGLLAWRTARRVWADPPHRRRFLLALPAFLLFALAWATGEASGAILGDSVAR